MQGRLFAHINSLCAEKHRLPFYKINLRAEDGIPSSSGFVRPCSDTKETLFIPKLTNTYFPMSTTPLVSIRCLVYNHEPYLRQCLEGFVMQKTNFPFEAIVHDDASTDGSAAIIREYAEKYPDIIKPIYETENQYSKRDGSIRRIMDEHMRGKYIAMCEGDDYWIDPQKLQKQVELLEANPNVSLCCGGYISKQKNLPDVMHVYKKGENGFFRFSLEDWGKIWYTKTLTVLYRSEAAGVYRICAENYSHSRDTHLFYHLLNWGDGLYLSDCLGVYNLHAGGVCSLVSKAQKAKDGYNSYKELFVVNGGEFLRKRYFRSILRRMIHEKATKNLFFEGKGIAYSLGDKCILLFVLLFSPFLRFLLK